LASDRPLFAPELVSPADHDVPDAGRPGMCCGLGQGERRRPSGQGGGPPVAERRRRFAASVSALRWAGAGRSPRWRDDRNGRLLSGFLGGGGRRRGRRVWPSRSAPRSARRGCRGPGPGTSKPSKLSADTFQLTGVCSDASETRCPASAKRPKICRFSLLVLLLIAVLACQFIQLFLYRLAVAIWDAPGELLFLRLSRLVQP